MRRFFMRSWTFVCISAAIVALFTLESKALKQTQSNVRVRVIKDAEHIELRIKNLVIYDRTGTKLTLSNSNHYATVTLTKTLQDSLPQVHIQSANLKKPASSLELQYPVDFYGSQISVEGKDLPSPLRITLIQGQMSGISTLKTSDYLIGVLHKEMSGKWPKEAMKAQAIATRSYSLAQISARTQEEFDLEGSVLDQDFEWVSPAMRLKPEIVNWQKAIDETRDMILVSSDGQTLKAYYHADCGGETTVPELVWGPKGEFQSVKDSVCVDRKHNRWHLEISKAAIQRKVAGEESEASKVKFDWVKSTFDKRVTWVEWTAGFTGSASDAWQLLSGQNFRRLLGFDQLRSTRFKATDKGDRMYFEGQGFGHGVGLCQWGSKDWAEKGWNVWKILNHYYPKAKISFWRDSILAEVKAENEKVRRTFSADKIGNEIKLDKTSLGRNADQERVVPELD